MPRRLRPRSLSSRSPLCPRARPARTTYRVRRRRASKDALDAIAYADWGGRDRATRWRSPTRGSPALAAQIERGGARSTSSSRPPRPGWTSSEGQGLIDAAGRGPTSSATALVLVAHGRGPAAIGPASTSRALPRRRQARHGAGRLGAGRRVRPRRARGASALWAAVGAPGRARPRTSAPPSRSWRAGEAPLGIVYGSDVGRRGGGRRRVGGRAPSPSEPPPHPLPGRPRRRPRDPAARGLPRPPVLAGGRRGLRGAGLHPARLTGADGLGPDEGEAVALSLRVAVVATPASLPPGARSSPTHSRAGAFPGAGCSTGVVHLPLILPPVVTGYLLLLAFGRRGPVGARRSSRGSGSSSPSAGPGPRSPPAVMAFPLLVRAIRLARRGGGPAARGGGGRRSARGRRASS